MTDDYEVWEIGVDGPTYQRLKRAADAAGLTVDAFCERALIRDLERDLPLIELDPTTAARN